MKKEFVEIEVENDIDDDRYLTYEQFKELLNFLPPYSKTQAFALYAGMTGFRPEECARARLDFLLFDDRQQPVIANRITKYKKKTYFDAQGRVVATKLIRQKKRNIPLWVRDYFEEYIRRNWSTMANSYLFPNGKGEYIDSKGWCSFWSKLRKRMTLVDPVRYSWVNDNVCPKVVNGKLIWVKRLSGYAFRKSRATWYAMACMEKGVQDVLLCTAHFLGHGSKSIGSTYKYVKSLMVDSVDGSMQPLKAPDLNENILGVESKRSEVDLIIQKLVSDSSFRELVAKELTKVKIIQPKQQAGIKAKN